nr:MAG TPA: hypothetical protein [Caudoviricetes sp.]
MSTTPVVNYSMEFKTRERRYTVLPPALPPVS